MKIKMKKLIMMKIILKKRRIKAKISYIIKMKGII